MPVIIGPLNSIKVTISQTICIFKKWVKIYKRGAFIEACYDPFFNEIIEYVFTNEEPARFLKKLELEL